MSGCMRLCDRRSSLESTTQAAPSESSPGCQHAQHSNGNSPDMGTAPEDESIPSNTCVEAELDDAAAKALLGGDVESWLGLSSLQQKRYLRAMAGRESHCLLYSRGQPGDGKAWRISAFKLLGPAPADSFILC